MKYKILFVKYFQIFNIESFILFVIKIFVQYCINENIIVLYYDINIIFIRFKIY
jgi:hypothetical protein